MLERSNHRAVKTYKLHSALPACAACARLGGVRISYGMHVQQTSL
jgi:hypothetical protein